MEEKVYVLSTEVEVMAENPSEAKDTGLEDVKQLGLVWKVKEKEEPKFVIAITGGEIRIPLEDENIEYRDVRKTTLLMGTYQAPTKEQAIKRAAEHLDVPESILFVYAEVK